MRVWRNWQTRMVQVHVRAISCRFKSCYPHQENSPSICLGCFLHEANRRRTENAKHSLAFRFSSFNIYKNFGEKLFNSPVTPFKGALCFWYSVIVCEMHRVCRRQTHKLHEYEALIEAESIIRSEVLCRVQVR